MIALEYILLITFQLDLKGSILEWSATSWVLPGLSVLNAIGIPAHSSLGSSLLVATARSRPCCDRRWAPFQSRLTSCAWYMASFVSNHHLRSLTPLSNSFLATYNIFVVMVWTNTPSWLDLCGAPRSSASPDCWLSSSSLLILVRVPAVRPCSVSTCSWDCSPRSSQISSAIQSYGWVCPFCSFWSSLRSSLQLGKNPINIWTRAWICFEEEKKWKRCGKSPPLSHEKKTCTCAYANTN